MVIGCGSKKESNTIKIGAILPLTGDGAQIGALSNDAINLAINGYNNKKNLHNPKIIAIIEDDKLDPKISVSAFQKLHDVNDVKIVIGPISSGATLAVAPLANKNKVTIISTGASANKVTRAGSYIFRVELSDKSGGIKQAEYARDSLNFKNMAILYVNNDYGQGLASVFSKKFKELGGSVDLSDGFQQGTTDFRTILTRIKALKVDAIFFVFNTEIVPFIKQKYELKVKAKVFTTPVLENQKYLNDLGKLANGIRYIYYGTFNKDNDDSLGTHFIQMFQKNYNQTPDYYAALAYDATGIVIKTLKDVDYDLSKFNNALYKIKNYPGVTGNISFDQNGDVEKPVTLKTVRNEKFTNY